MRFEGFLKGPSVDRYENPSKPFRDPFRDPSKTFLVSGGSVARNESLDSFVLIFVEYCTIIARYVAKWGITQMRLCEATNGVGMAPFSESAGPALDCLKRYLAIWGIATIASHYCMIMIWGPKHHCDAYRVSQIAPQLCRECW